MGFIEDERGISNVIGAALLVVAVVLGVGALMSAMQSMTDVPEVPRAQFDISDHPDSVTAANANGFIVRHLGGDRINYNDLLLVVYDSNGNKIYSKIVSDAASANEVTQDQVSGAPYDTNFFEGGEQIIAAASILDPNNDGTPDAGTYEIALYYKPTMSVLVDRNVMIS